MRSAAILLAVVASSCGGPAKPSGLPPTTVLTFGVGTRWGSEQLRVAADGSATYDARGSEPGQEIHVDSRATPEEIATVLRVFRANDLCGLRSHRSTGVSEEGRPDIAVRAEGLDCQVTLWDGEWRDDVHAAACMRAVRDLTSALEKRTAKTP